VHIEANEAIVWYKRSVVAEVTSVIVLSALEEKIDDGRLVVTPVEALVRVPDKGVELAGRAWQVSEVSELKIQMVS
jgi:hypothetical protein